MLRAVRFPLTTDGLWAGAAALIVSVLAVVPTRAQSLPGIGQTLGAGPLAAWCAPGQWLLIGAPFALVSLIVASLYLWLRYFAF